MKRIPETFELDEEDIRTAITYWLNNEVLPGDFEFEEFDIEFSTEEVAVRPPDGAPVGGQSDWRKTVIKAIAERE